MYSFPKSACFTHNFNLQNENKYESKDLAQLAEHLAVHAGGPHLIPSITISQEILQSTEPGATTEHCRVWVKKQNKQTK